MRKRHVWRAQILAVLLYFLDCFLISMGVVHGVLYTVTYIATGELSALLMAAVFGGLAFALALHLLARTFGGVSLGTILVNLSLPFKDNDNG